MKNRVQFIPNDDSPAYAVLPYADYLRLIGDDRAALSDEEIFDRAMAADEESFPEEIAARLTSGENPIRVFRRHRKLTQSDLADKIGSTSTYVSQLENGVRKGSVEMLKAIAAALNVDLDDLA
jgi:DNA-binding XRE family transcriptional regulator